MIVRRMMMHGCGAPLLALAVAAAAPPSAAGQDAGARVPQARMDAFVRALETYYERDSILAFFPERGTWTWRLTSRSDAGIERVGLWRFRRGDLLPAVDPSSGPLCESFSHGGDAITLGTLMYTLHDRPGRWRRVGSNRFVPPGAPARSPIFVEWRREAGRWVISAYGDTRHRSPRLLGRALDEVVPDDGPRQPPGPTDTVYATGRRWYEDNEPITVEGNRLIKYGLPRPIEPELLVRYGWVDGVPVFREAGTRGPIEVVYLPVASGMYSPYQDNIGTGCM